MLFAVEMALTDVMMSDFYLILIIVLID